MNRIRFLLLVLLSGINVSQDNLKTLSDPRVLNIKKSHDEIAKNVSESRWICVNTKSDMRTNLGKTHGQSMTSISARDRNQQLCVSQTETSLSANNPSYGFMLSRLSSRTPWNLDGYVIGKPATLQKRTKGRISPPTNFNEFTIMILLTSKGPLGIKHLLEDRSIRIAEIEDIGPMQLQIVFEHSEIRKFKPVAVVTSAVFDGNNHWAPIRTTSKRADGTFEEVENIFEFEKGRLVRLFSKTAYYRDSKEIGITDREYVYSYEKPSEFKNYLSDYGYPEPRELKWSFRRYATWAIAVGVFAVCCFFLVKRMRIS